MIAFEANHPVNEFANEQCREILDPLTGELVSLSDSERLTHLHERLEDIALELLATCHQIRTSLDLQSRMTNSFGGFDEVPGSCSQKGRVA